MKKEYIIDKKVSNENIEYESKISKEARPHPY